MIKKLPYIKPYPDLKSRTLNWEEYANLNVSKNISTEEFMKGIEND